MSELVGAPKDWKTRDVIIGGERFTFSFPGLGNCAGGVCRRRLPIGAQVDRAAVTKLTDQELLARISEVLEGAIV